MFIWSVSTTFFKGRVAGRSVNLFCFYFFNFSFCLTGSLDMSRSFKNHQQHHQITKKIRKNQHTHNNNLQTILLSYIFCAI